MKTLKKQINPHQESMNRANDHKMPTMFRLQTLKCPPGSLGLDPDLNSTRASAESMYSPGADRGP
mgnify:CR=1 FL=1|jgi:hypothetical protein